MSMVKVECDDCKSPYQIEERRIPATGLKMRCSKCGKSLLVHKPAPEDAEEADLPAPAPPRPKSGPGPVLPRAAAPAAPAAPPKPTVRAAPAKPPAPAPARPTAPATPAARPMPAAPPPPPPPASAIEDDDLDLPVVRGGEAKRPASSPSTDEMLAFGEIDLPAPARPTVRKMAAVPLPDPEEEELDLPAPARPTVRQMVAPVMPEVDEEEELDLPAPARPAARNKVTPPATSALEIDLPAPARPAPARPAPRKAAAVEADLPMPASRRAPASAIGFGEIDLPAPSRPGRANGFGEIDLPAPVRAAPPREADAGGFGEIDLPEIESTAPTFGEIELPSTDLPAPSASFGDLDLPIPEASSAPFGEIDLPLPPASTRRPPARAEKATPLAPPQDEAAFNFGELDLPLVGDDAPPSAPARPAPPAGDSGEFRFDEALDAAFGAPPSRPAAKAPPAATPAPAPRREEHVGEEFSFGELAEPDMDLSTGAIVPGAAKRPEPAPPPAIPAAAPAPAAPVGEPGAGIGDEVDLAAGEAGAGGEAALRRDKLAKTGRDTGRTGDLGKGRGRSRARIYVVAAVTLLAVGGGALALVPEIGPFGAHAIGDRLNAPAHAQALADLEKNVQASLDEDTFVAATRALSDARAAQTVRPRHRPTAAYAAFVAFMRSVRHGRRGDDETLGKQLLALAKDDPGPERSLAIAAEQAAAKNLDEARRSVKAVLDASPDNLDAAVLLGEIELAAGGREAPLAAWKRAVAIKKSARTLHGLALAQQNVRDFPGAEASARAVLEASPKHAGARILLAEILFEGRNAAREAEALELLAKVTGEGEVRSAASEAQLVEAFVATGAIHLGRSRVSAAEKAFAAALQIDPRSVGALYGAGELLFQSGRFSQALQRFEEAMKADEANVEARIGAAKTMLALERRKDAKELLAKIQSDKPLEAGGVAFWRGIVEESLGNKKDAEQLYLEAIKRAGDNPVAVEAYVVLANLLSAQGRGEEAQAKLAEAQSKWPELPALYRAKGELFLLNGRYAEARKEFEAALAKEDNLDTRFKLGVTLRRMRAFEEAGAAFDKLAELDKDFPGLALERGLLFEEMGQSERALEMYADALKKAPSDIDLKLRVGSTQVIAGHPAQAEPILREVLKERAGSADANHFLGRALLLKGGQMQEAMRFLEQAINIDGNRAEYHLYVGWAANELGQTTRAESALARALELDRELADAYWQRGVLLQKQGRTLDALADLQTALDKRPTRYEAYATMALCYQEQARWPDAMAAWQKAVAGNGSVAEWHYRLGKIYDANGNRLAATPELEKAITLADGKGKSPPVWLFDAHFLFAEAMRASGQKEKAIASYRRYLELAPPGNAYRVDAERALQSLGAAQP